jgi:tetratricopeptide (TPR) repeat protein
MVASKFASPEYDVRMISEKAQVDAILTGSILSDGERLRVTTQLVQAPDGALLWSNTAQVSLRDIFMLQDNLVDRIVQSLAVPLTAREQRALKHDVPASAVGYEFFLRANQLIAEDYNARNVALARDLYLQSVEADPKYAPGWACLARTYRYLGKFVGDPAGNAARAEAAFQKAFGLNPDLALTHNLYTAHETDLGRSLDAMARLLKRAHTHANDPDLLTGLVQACRYCGLLNASLAADGRARQLDPSVRTSVSYTYLHLGEFQKALDHCPAPSDLFVLPRSLEALGRRADAIAMTKEYENGFPEPHRQWFVAVRACLEGDYPTAAAAFHKAPSLVDPEARFLQACFLARVQESERAMEFLSLALDGGYRCHRGLLYHPWLKRLRSDARFTDLVNRASEMSLQARTVFLANGGGRILGAA